jgi:hypothetical protein
LFGAESDDEISDQQHLFTVLDEKYISPMKDFTLKRPLENVVKHDVNYNGTTFPSSNFHEPKRSKNIDAFLSKQFPSINSAPKSKFVIDTVNQPLSKKSTSNDTVPNSKVVIDTVIQPLSKKSTSTGSAPKSKFVIDAVNQPLSTQSTSNDSVPNSKVVVDTLNQPLSKNSTSTGSAPKSKFVIDAVNDSVPKIKFNLELLPLFIYHYKTIDETVFKESVHSYSTKKKCFYSNTFSCGGVNWAIKYVCIDDNVSIFVKCQSMKEMPSDTVIKVSYVLGISNTQNESNAIIKQCSDSLVIFTYDQDTIGFKTFCKSDLLVNSNDAEKSRAIIQNDSVDLTCIIRVHENTLTLML